MPILNGITNLVKLGEMAVKTEPHHGRAVHLEAMHLRAAAAGPDREFRKHYGADIYPTVKAP